MSRDDEFLGRATVQTSVVAERGHIEGMWVDLEECQSGKAKVPFNIQYIQCRAFASLKKQTFRALLWVLFLFCPTKALKKISAPS